MMLIGHLLLPKMTIKMHGTYTLVMALAMLGILRSMSFMFVAFVNLDDLDKGL